MADTHNTHEHAVPEMGFDRHEPKSSYLGWLTFSIVGLLFILIGGVWYLTTVAVLRVEEDQVQRPVAEDYRNIRAREEQQLNQYEYIDKEKGVVRLPIDRAMALLAQEASENRVSYNTKTYPVKVEGPGGVAGTPVGGSPVATPAQGSPQATQAVGKAH